MISAAPPTIIAPANVGLDIAVLVGVTIAGISAAAALLPRLAKG